MSGQGDPRPSPRAEDVARLKLLPVAPVPFATTVSLSLVQAAGPSGLRPQHINGGLLPGDRDEIEIVWALHAVVGVMEESPVVSWIASASLTALKKKDASHRPMAVGETLRRLTAKALLATLSEDMTRYLHPLQLGVQNSTRL